MPAERPVRPALAGAASVWLRNATVWQATWKTSLVGAIGEPLFYLLGLGYGLGTIIPAVADRPTCTSSRPA